MGRWEIAELNTPERILEKIFDEVDSRGVLVFGVDSPFKEKICNFIAYSRGDAFFFEIMVLDGRGSCNHAERHEAVMELKEKGVKDVVGVYVKSRSAKPLDNPPTVDGLTYLITISEEGE
jgi:hypothetical protein